MLDKNIFKNISFISLTKYLPLNAEKYFPNLTTQYLKQTSLDGNEKAT